MEQLDRDQCWCCRLHVGQCCKAAGHWICEDCLGYVRPPNLVFREWARCYCCGWWEWAPCTLTTICQFCLHKTARHLERACRILPLNICAKIGEMLAPKRNIKLILRLLKATKAGTILPQNYHRVLLFIDHLGCLWMWRVGSWFKM